MESWRTCTKMMHLQSAQINLATGKKCSLTFSSFLRLLLCLVELSHFWLIVITILLCLKDMDSLISHLKCFAACYLLHRIVAELQMCYINIFLHFPTADK